MISNDLLRAYLLGTMDEPQKEIIEHAYLTNDEENERLSAAEEDLIEDYLHGKLDLTERNNFELFFLLSPERREDLALTRALREAGEKQGLENATERWNPPFHHFRPPLVGVWAAMGLLLVSAAVSISLYTKNRTLRSELASLQQQHSRLQAASQSPVGAQPISVPVLVELRPGLTRDIGDAVPLIRGLKGTEAVNFVLQVPDPNYASYYVVLRSAEGDELLSQARLPLSGSSAGPVVSLWLSASALEPGDYEFVLFGMQRNGNKQHSPIAFYNFRVPKM